MATGPGSNTPASCQVSPVAAPQPTVNVEEQSCDSIVANPALGSDDSATDEQHDEEAAAAAAAIAAATAAANAAANEAKEKQKLEKKERHAQKKLIKELAVCRAMLEGMEVCLNSAISIELLI